jgi:DNA modification methylase
MQVEAWPIDRPKPYPRNARKITEAAIEKVAASLREFGWRQPIVVDVEDVIIAGHARLLAAKKLRLVEVPVHVATELTPEQVRQYRLMDNRSHDETAWDYEMLTAELFDLKGLNLDLSLTGFDEDELSQFLVDKTAGLTDEDEIPAKPEVAVTQPGDLWLLGRHRLLCGDSTKGNVVVEQLLPRGELADMAFTDPPYNVDYEGYTEEKLTIQGDRMTREQFTSFLVSAFVTCQRGLKVGGSLYLCHPSSWQREFEDSLENADFEVRCQIIWAKNTFAWGFGRYKFQHEPIFYCHRKGQSDPWYGDKSQSTLWQEKKPSASRLHPTMKPVELVDRAIANSSKPGDVVLDLFGGAGSTLIACEKVQRNARLVEIDPLYCDVIIERWQNFAGKQATLGGAGGTFAETAGSRKAVAA